MDRGPPPCFKIFIFNLVFQLLDPFKEDASRFPILEDAPKQPSSQELQYLVFGVPPSPFDLVLQVKPQFPKNLPSSQKKHKKALHLTNLLHKSSRSHVSEPPILAWPCTSYPTIPKLTHHPSPPRRDQLKPWASQCVLLHV